MHMQEVQFRRKKEHFEELSGTMYQVIFEMYVTDTSWLIFRAMFLIDNPVRVTYHSVVHPIETFTLTTPANVVKRSSGRGSGY